MDATPKFPVNEKIMELAHILKPELIELSQSHSALILITVNYRLRQGEFEYI